MNLILPGLIVVAIFVLVCIHYYKMPDEKLNRELYGERNPNVICPHCQVKGQVHTKKIVKKTGISGGKATAAILTGGVSMLATGLSRKDHLTQAHCCNCESDWTF